MLSDIPSRAGAASRRGVQLETATGERITNLGEQLFAAHTDNRPARRMTAHVRDVNWALLSARMMMAFRAHSGIQKRWKLHSR